MKINMVFVKNIFKFILNKFDIKNSDEVFNFFIDLLDIIFGDSRFITDAFYYAENDEKLIHILILNSILFKTNISFQDLKNNNYFNFENNEEELKSSYFYLKKKLTT